MKIRRWITLNKYKKTFWSENTEKLAEKGQSSRKINYEIGQVVLRVRFFSFCLRKIFPRKTRQNFCDFPVVAIWPLSLFSPRGGLVHCSYCFASARCYPSLFIVSLQKPASTDCDPILRFSNVFEFEKGRSKMRFSDDGFGES